MLVLKSNFDNINDIIDINLEPNTFKNYKLIGVGNYNKIIKNSNKI